MQYQGTLLLVSHDRAFLDNVVTSVLVFEEHARVAEYIGGYADWLAFSEQQKKAVQIQLAETAVKKEKPKTVAPKKLSYKEQRELEQLPLTIENLENQQVELTALINDPEFYKQSPERVATTLAQLESLAADLSAAYARWEVLDALNA